jgi:membrane protease YdiL (CAAX protease family)
MNKNIKTEEYILISIIVLLTIALPIIGYWSASIEFSKKISAVVNQQLIYQSSTLILTITFLIILWKLKKKEFVQHFKKGNIAATITPVPIVGIKPKNDENWLHLGKNFSIVITAVTLVVIYFQVISGNNFDYSKLLFVLPISVCFSLVNSFVEESITRLGIVITLKYIMPDKYIMIVSGIIFGCVHYFGTPGGIIGVLVAGFLGWFLAKSILETKGFFWAWFIHFLQDVVIITAMLAIE